MRKQTNLAEVKLTALALLSTEINETPYSPMIVKHPFTDTGVSAIPDGKGGVEMIDLTEDDAQLRWRQSMARQIDKADKASWWDAPETPRRWWIPATSTPL